MDINILKEDQVALLSHLISDAQTILVTCHKSPDGDAIGSCLGWAEYLRSLGKDPVVIVPDQYPDFLTWLPNTEKIVRYDKHREKCDMLLKIADLVFCLDFNTPSRVEDMQQSLVASPAKRVLIDHHLNPDVPTVLSISKPEASSTCELVFRIVWQLGGFSRINKQFAIPIYCGMMTDTGGFTFNSSNPEIFYIISELLTKRIDKDRIYRNVYHNYSEDRLRLMGYVMYEKLVYLPEFHAAFYTLTKEEQQRFHFIKGDAEGLVNIPQQIKGLKLSISLREDTEKRNLIWVSLRSVDDFPCNKMAEEFFNGGGHLNASGGRVNGTMEEAVETVNKAIQAYSSLLKKS
ncbi:MAG: bifunctional oligoribonuclease/PAP phosphatase NrnA [Prevotella sp.]|nr:bifunctional oligoribonuclease/PAP phosphatase NrnA [Prevotella sp.]